MCEATVGPTYQQRDRPIRRLEIEARLDRAARPERSIKVC